MGRPFILHYDDIHCIHCRICRTQVGFMRDYLCTSMGYEVYIFDNVFNVEVPEDKRYQKVLRDGRTMNDTYCVKCGNLIGWKVIAVDKPWIIIREGVFLMDLHNVDLTIQGGGVNEQAANVQGGDANEQGGANEQNDEQQGDGNEQGGANEQNDEQEGDGNEQGGANEQNDEQEGDANEQGGENEQNHEQEGDANEDVDLLAEGIANVDLNPNI